MDCEARALTASAEREVAERTRFYDDLFFCDTSDLTHTDRLSVTRPSDRLAGVWRPTSDRQARRVHDGSQTRAHLPPLRRTGRDRLARHARTAEAAWPPEREYHRRARCARARAEPVRHAYASSGDEAAGEGRHPLTSASSLLRFLEPIGPLRGSLTHVKLRAHPTTPARAHHLAITLCHAPCAPAASHTVHCLARDRQGGDDAAPERRPERCCDARRD